MHGLLRDDSRTAQRFPLTLPVRVSADGAGRVSATAVNLSCSGVYLDFLQPPAAMELLRPGERVQLDFKLKVAGANRHFDLTAHVVRLDFSDSGRLGVGATIDAGALPEEWENVLSQNVIRSSPVKPESTRGSEKPPIGVAGILSWIIMLAALAYLLWPYRSINAQPAPSGVPRNSTVQVWVEANTGTYYCAGSVLYGKTPKGRYMVEREAYGAGYRASLGRTCDGE